jgi:hypothetical protein
MEKMPHRAHLEPTLLPAALQTASIWTRLWTILQDEWRDARTIAWSARVIH